MMFTVKEPAEEHIHFPDEATQTQDFQISMREGTWSIFNIVLWYLSMNFNNKMLKPYRFSNFCLKSSSKIRYFDDEGGDNKLCSA